MRGRGTPRTARRRPRVHERGAALAGVLVVMAALMGVAALAAVSAYTNLLTSTNLTAAAGARASAETAINEALYRLSLLDTDANAIAPTLTDPDWQMSIMLTTGDANASDQTLSTIQTASDWPSEHDPSVPVVTMQFKKDANGNLLYYNRAVPGANPPFLAVNLPNPVGTIVGNVYELLCGVPSILGVQVGGILGLCPGNVSSTGYPVIQLRATGIDARGAEREVVAEIARSVEFTPLAPLNAGGNVDLNGIGFIDGVNHDHRIVLTGDGGSAAIYGDEAAETTNTLSVLGLPIANTDSPDDCDIWTGGPLLLPLPLGPIRHGVANASLLLYLQLTPPYTSFPRLFNRQISSTDSSAAWVGVGQLNNVINTALTLPDLGLVTAANIGIWTGVNFGYSSAIALSPNATVSNAPAVLPNTNTSVWASGVYSWRLNNMNNPGTYHGSVNLAATTPAVGTVQECGPTVQGAAVQSLVCRPSALSPFPQFREYLGIQETPFDDLLQNPDTDQTELDAGQPPIGFTYVAGDYTLTGLAANPGTNDFGLLYVDGDLTVQGVHTFKGVMFVDGDLRIANSAHLTVLGAVLARDTVTHIGTGHMTLLYSREAALRGLAHAKPWRVLSWVDAEMEN